MGLICNLVILTRFSGIGKHIANYIPPVGEGTLQEWVGWHSHNSWKWETYGGWEGC
jgi:hypothetical protein